MMRITKLALCLLLLAGSSHSQSPNTSVTKSGCLQSLNGQFVLMTDKGEQIILKGDHDTMFGYTGKQIQVTGTLKAQTKQSPKPAEMHVSKVKKLADGCQQ